MSIAKRRTPIPNLHFVMIIIVFTLIVMCAIAYALVPADRSDLYKQVILMMVGLIAGKLSNSFGVMPSFSPTVDHPDESEAEVPAAGGEK